MKNYNKILIVLLVISVITSAFVLSVSADDTVVLPSPPIDDDYLVKLYTTNPDVYRAYPYSMITSSNSNEVIMSFGKIPFYGYTVGDDEWYTINVDSQSVSYSLSEFLYDSGGVYLTDNKIEVELPSCDGSACPANDGNLDGICDDCGAPMTMSLRSPTLEEMKASAPYYHYFIYKTVDTTTGAYVDTRLSFLTSNSPMTLTTAEWDRTNDSPWGSVSFRFTSDSDIDGVNYVSSDGGVTWDRNTTYSNGTTLFYVDENFVSSTFDFVDKDTGELFFPLPLWEITQGVTTETLNNQTTQAVAGTMTTLTLCGVGLMALLVVLSLFGKRSLISIKR